MQHDGETGYASLKTNPLLVRGSAKVRSGSVQCFCGGTNRGAYLLAVFPGFIEIQLLLRGGVVFRHGSRIRVR